MVADARTPILGLLKQGTGNNNNLWGDLLNTQVIDLVEQAITGSATIGVTGGSITLSESQARCRRIVLTGALSSDQTIVVPNRTQGWQVINKTTGSNFVLVKTASGSPVNAPQGCVTDIVCDGSGSVERADRKQVGNYFFHAGSAPPPGAFECDHSAKKRASAVDLYAAISTLHGSNDSTDFLLPPGKDTGRYLRARTSSVAAGTIQSNQNKSHNHTGSGTTGNQSASHTHSASGTTGNMSANASHTHTGYLPNWGRRNLSLDNIGGLVNDGSGNEPVTIESTSVEHTHSISLTTGTESSNHTHTFSFTTSDSGGTEARPESIVGILCVWY